MTIQGNSVLLLKAQISEDGSDKYQLLLSQQGFTVKQVKTLDFVYKNLNILQDKLKNPSDYNGLIFSSPRCVNAVHQTLESSLHDDWRAKFNFVVGEATYRDCLSKLDLECNGKETGNAENLSKLIVAGKSQYGNKPFLFPHGNLKTDTLKTELGKEGLAIEGVLVYDTIPNPSLEDELSSVTDHFSTVSEYVVFYSPSGVRSTVKYLQKLPVDLKRIKFIAIGPVTEKAITEENLPVYSTAKTPTPEDVLHSIMSGT